MSVTSEESRPETFRLANRAGGVAVALLATALAIVCAVLVPVQASEADAFPWWLAALAVLVLLAAILAWVAVGRPPRLVVTGEGLVLRRRALRLVRIPWDEVSSVEVLDRPDGVWLGWRPVGKPRRGWGRPNSLGFHGAMLGRVVGASSLVDSLLEHGAPDVRSNARKRPLGR